MSQAAKTVNGVHTELLVQIYGDRVLILVTQLGKVGSLIEASIPMTTPLPLRPIPPALPNPPASIQLTPLLGQPPSEHMQILYNLYASQIATIWWTSNEKEGMSRKPVVVGIALKKGQSDASEDQGDDESPLLEHERVLFREVMDMLSQLLH
ncbi:hypothetical protein FRC02_001057 [Tulasnella sp. 418]|nr:hypothetical protein FRC02_001057 [Tulasnella sp. 418]